MSGNANVAEVIPFPQRSRRPDCRICAHAVVGEQMTYCMIFQEFLLDEVTAASDCEVYDEDEHKS